MTLDEFMVEFTKTVAKDPQWHRTSDGLIRREGMRYACPVYMVGKNRGYDKISVSEVGKKLGIGKSDMTVIVTAADYAKLEAAPESGGYTEEEVKKHREIRKNMLSIVRKGVHNG